MTLFYHHTQILKMDSSLFFAAILGLLLTIFESASAAYPPNFNNQSGCLYTYMDEGKYHISLPEMESESGLLPLSKLVYNKDASNCTNGLFPGLLVVDFNTHDNYMERMTLEFSIKASPSEGYWEVKKVTLKIKPVNKDLFSQDSFELKAADMYAGERFSYSCNELVLTSQTVGKNEPSFKITLKKFQLQPFAELPKVVFAPSYDCSVWLTLPVVMGMLLMLFIIFTVMIGVHLLLEQGNQTSDLKFSKQGGMLLNQAQLDATKG